jgi:hypothetical protein
MRKITATIVFILALSISALAQGNATPRKVLSIPGSCDPTGTRGDVILWKITTLNQGLYLCDPVTKTFQFQTNTFSASLVLKTMLYADASAAIKSTAAPTDGQLLIGDTSDVPALGTLTGTTNETLITNGAHSITIGLAATIKHKAATFFQLTDSTDTTKIAEFDVANVSAGQTRTMSVPDSDTKLPIASQFLTFTGPTAARTVTLPDGDTTVPSASQQITFAGPSVARTVTLPDANITVARTDAANTFTGNQTYSGVQLNSSGSAAAPSVSFSGDPNTGIIDSAADALGFVTGGTERWVINSSGALNPATNNVNDIGNGSVNPRDVNVARQVVLHGSTSGSTNLKAAATAGSTTITLPGGTTDFSATGGANQVVQQTTAGGAFTVGQLASTNLSDTANVAMRNVANTFTKANTVTPVTLTDAATVETDAALSNNFRVTLGGNRTLGNPTNPTDGQVITWEIIQDGTGSRTLTLDSKFALGSDIAAVVLTTTAGKRDFLSVIYNSSADKYFVRGFVKGY